MRLAQRNHRSRKEGEFLQLQERAGNLTTALEEVVNVFTKFHERVLALELGHIPVLFSREMDMTALEIASISRKVLLQKEGGDKLRSIAEDHRPQMDGNTSAKKGIKSPAQSAGERGSLKQINTPRALNKSPKRTRRSFPLARSLNVLPRENPTGGTSFEDLYLKACLERAYRLLTDQTLLDDEIIPAMMIPLRVESLEGCRVMASNALAVPKGHLGDFFYHTTIAMSKLPAMYRVVERQGSHYIPRLPGPFLQQIEYGRTRTRLATDLPQLQGDWLEVADVLEYLDMHGISLSMTDALPSKLQIPRGFLPLASQSFQDPYPQKVHFPSPGHVVPTGQVSMIGSAYDASMAWVPPVHFPELSQGSWRPNTSDTLPSSVPRYTQHQLPDALMDVPPMPATESTYQVSEPLGNRPEEDAMVAVTETHNFAAELDVSKLIARLARYAVCLGLVPGLRREDVDLAIMESIRLSPLAQSAMVYTPDHQALPALG
jgi:hypothetical protein